ncbi:hypothetical protein F4803DRAFT_238422 [Xylaria telfairii]|nr:hypothetical protein F4803DRAFT_238422 [Xylaria telfairii]
MASPDRDSGSGSDESSDEGPSQHVPIYCLTKLSESEKATYQKALNRDEQEDYIKIEFVDWTQDKDGDMENMHRIWTENSERENMGIHYFAFFVDRFGVNDTSVIIAQPDSYTLVYCDEAQAWAQELVNRQFIAHGEEPNSVLVIEAMVGEEEPLKDARERALNYGRVYAGDMKLAWCNLNIANMGIGELVTMDRERPVAGGGVLHTLENKNWDTEAFGKRLYEAVKKRET